MVRGRSDSDKVINARWLRALLSSFNGDMMSRGNGTGKTVVQIRHCCTPCQCDLAALSLSLLVSSSPYPPISKT